MSTFQPPDGANGAPGLAQPQDPWEGGFEPGVAAVPVSQQATRAQDPYAGYAGAYPYVPQLPPRRGRAGLVALLMLGVLVLGGGGGYAAWYFYTTQVTTDPTTGITTGVPTLDPHTAAVNSCFVNVGSDSKPRVLASACTTSGSYKIIKIASGTGIKENAEGKFDDKTTAADVCKNTGFTFYYGYQDPTGDQSKDIFFCLTRNP